MHATRTRLVAVALVIAFSVLAPGSRAQAADGLEAAPPVRLRVAYEDTHSFPFHLGVGGRVPDENPGISIEMMRLAAERLGFEVRFERLPWRRCLQKIGANRVDAVFNTSYRYDRLLLARYPSRDGEVDRSRRLMTTHYAFYRLVDSPVRWDGTHLFARGGDPSALFRGPIGSVSGYSVSALLRERDYQVDDVGTRNSSLSLRKLLTGRVPVIVDSESRMRWFVGRDPEHLAEIEMMQPPIFERDYYVVLSHAFVDRHPELAEGLWDEIARLRDAPEIAAAFERYEALLEEMSESSVALTP